MSTIKRFRAVLLFVLFGMWFVLGALGGPTFGKISGISTNDLADFLPSNAESTQVQELQRKFGNSKAIPAIILLESERPFTQSEIADYKTMATKLAAVEGVEGKVIGPMPSADFKALQFVASISIDAEAKDTVQLLRTAASQNLATGTKAYVTGPAGVGADLAKAFGGIDGILLVVALTAVFIILLVVYRSALLPFLVLLNAVLALCAAIFVVYLLAKHDIVELNGQGQGILSILVIGATTDYSLLLIARYREALVNTESKWRAMWTGWKHAFEPVLASAATVILALMCLLVSDLNSNRSLGPIAATGIVFAFLASLTLLPALLVTFGTIAFWPARVKQSSNKPTEITTGKEDLQGIWQKAATLVAARPRQIWIGVTVCLVVCSLGLFQLKANGVPQTELILSQSNAVDGQEAIERHFSAGVTAPLVVAAPIQHAQDATHKLRNNPAVADVMAYTNLGQSPNIKAARIVDGKALLSVTLRSSPYSSDAEDTVRNLRQELSAISPDILVGGSTALSLDTTITAKSDLQKIVPLVLLMIFIVLALLLRALIAPLLLILTVVLSFSATLGVSALVFNHVFHFPGSDAVVPLFAFVFLVALGVDYNIFLITRTREEAFKYGTRPAILHSLGKTGVVITSAGIVLAATFAALGIIPILFLAQLAFIVAFGVLIDTIIVRSLLVPALIYDVGRYTWWPSRKLKK